MPAKTTLLGTEFADTLLKALNSATIDRAVETGQWSESQWQQFFQLGSTSLLVREDSDGIGARLEEFMPVASQLGTLHARFPAIEAIVGTWLADVCGIAIADDAVTTVALASATEEHEHDRPLTLRDVAWGRYANTLVIVDANGDPSGSSKVAVLTPADADLQPAENIAGEARDTLRISVTPDFHECPVSWNYVLQFLALSRAAQMSGIMQEIVRMTSQYVSSREQFGRPLSRFQAIQHSLANMYAETMAATVATRAALCGKAEQISDFDACAAIVETRSAATKIASSAHQAHGAMGFTQEYALAEYSRRLWAWRDEYETETWWQDRLGTLVLADSDTLLQQLTKGSG